MRKSGRDKVRRVSVAARMWVDARLLPPRVSVILLGDLNCALSEAGGREGTKMQCVLHHQICELPSDELARMEELQLGFRRQLQHHAGGTQ